MKRYLWISISFFLIAAYGVTLMGCMTANQLAAEKAYYEAKAGMSNRMVSQPIFEMTASDASQPIILQNVSALRVYQLPASGNDNQFGQYQHRDFTPTWVNTTLQAAMPLGILYGGSLLIKAAGNFSSGPTYNQSVTGKGNTADLRTMGDMKVGDIRGTNTVGGIIDQTSTPTVVEQPAPIIVEQPPPIIVEPPPPVPAP